MNCIIVDFEWNQPLAGTHSIEQPFRFDAEIIEIGAVKLNERYETVGEFKLYVKPSFYPFLNADVVSLTKIRAQNLQAAPDFPEACALFSNWCGEDCCFCTWGPGDIPVLLDNMLMHGMDTPEEIRCCNLQQVFGDVVVRDRRQWSLENAVKLLGLPKERAHDALNDARNTRKLCDRVDLLPYAEEYCYSLINYGPERLGHFLDGRGFADLDDVLRDEAMTTMRCPCCGEQIVFSDWVSESKRSLLGWGGCKAGRDYLVRLRLTQYRHSRKVTASRSISSMTDLLWDRYLDAAEPCAVGAENAQTRCWSTENW